MIRHIAGTVSYIGDTYIVVDVSGIGYLIYVGTPSAYTLEKKVKLHTYLTVRETALDLYGFGSLDELATFELLLGLPKIGPKSAAQILANADLPLLQSAVVHNDPTHLSKMSGIGKKTAEKIVMGLKDKFEMMDFSGPDGDTFNQQSVSASFQTDAIDALISLGYPQSEARKSVQALPETITNTNDAVKEALKLLSKP